MSDRAAGMSVLMRQSKPIRDQALEAFAEQFRDEPLAMDRWLMMQATRHGLEGEAPVLEDVSRLRLHPCFSLRNPNKVRALISSFCNLNLAEFHEPSGKAYAWFEAQFLSLDAINPQVAARLARAMDRWSTLIEPMRSLAQASLKRLVAHQGLSPDSAEIIKRSLACQA
jgi:aminopeptidase N